VKNRVLNAIASAHGYQENIKDVDGNVIPNPQSKAAFAKRVIVNQLIDIVKSHESNIDVITARDAAEDKVDNEINIT